MTDTTRTDLITAIAESVAELVEETAPDHSVSDFDALTFANAVDHYVDAILASRCDVIATKHRNLTRFTPNTQTGRTAMAYVFDSPDSATAQHDEVHFAFAELEERGARVKTQRSHTIFVTRR